MRQAHAVVGDKHHFQVIAYVGIVVDHPGHVVDQMNNVFCHVVRRGGFTGKNIHTRHPVSGGIGFNAVIASDDVQDIHQLALVFMNTLDLHIKQRLRIHHHTHLLGNINRQTLFVIELGLTHRLIYQRVVDMLLQLA